MKWHSLLCALSPSVTSRYPSNSAVATVICYRRTYVVPTLDYGYKLQRDGDVGI